MINTRYFTLIVIGAALASRSTAITRRNSRDQMLPYIQFDMKALYFVGTDNIVRFSLTYVMSQNGVFMLADIN